VNQTWPRIVAQSSASVYVEAEKSPSRSGRLRHAADKQAFDTELSAKTDRSSSGPNRTTGIAMCIESGF
jgi:hypothetical protein